MSTSSVAELPAAERLQQPALALAWLSGAAVSLGESGDIDSALSELLDGVRRLLDASRVSMLMLDPDGRLVPVVSVAGRSDVALHRTFRSMRPIELDQLPDRRAWQTLTSSRVTVIPEAS